jgi:hypothetical protein
MQNKFYFFLSFELVVKNIIFEQIMAKCWIKTLYLCLKTTRPGKSNDLPGLEEFVDLGLF